MNIDRKKLREFSWFENNMHERVSDDDPSIAYYKSRFPLILTTKHYSCKNDENNDKTFNEMFEVNSGFASGEECIVAMVNSGDYTLSEAIVLYATSCERCNNVLQYKYLNGKEGYPEFSEEWKKTNTVCEYCEGIKEPEKNNYPQLKEVPIISLQELKNTNTTSYSKLCIENFDITHIIGNWPIELILRYSIISKRIMLNRIDIKYLHSGYGFNVHFDENGIFENEKVVNSEHYIGMGGAFDKSKIIKDIHKYLGITGWKDYFKIKEVKEFLEKNYNIDCDSLFSLT